MKVPQREDALKPRILVALALAGSAVAQTPEARVSLRDLTTEAMKNNPEIVAAQKSSEAARQRPTQESSLPDPMVSLGYANAGYPYPGAGLGRAPMANIRIMYPQEIPFPGKVKSRGEMASKEADASFQQYQAVQLGVISRLKQAYYRLQYTYAASDLLTRNPDGLNKLVG